MSNNKSDLLSKKDKKFLVGISVIVILAAIFFLRYNEIWPLSYHSTDLDGEYVKVECAKYPFIEWHNTITNPEGIKLCVEKVNEFKLREADWFDHITGLDGSSLLDDSKPLSVQYLLTFYSADGSTTEVTLPYTKDGHRVELMSKGGDLDYLYTITSR